MKHRDVKKITAVPTPIEKLMRPIADAYIDMWHTDKRPYVICGLNGTQPFFSVLENMLDIEQIPVGEIRFRIKKEDFSILSPTPADIHEEILRTIKKGRKVAKQERPLHFILAEDSSGRHIDARAMRDGIEALALPSNKTFTAQVKRAIKEGYYTYFGGSDLGGGHPDFKIIATEEALGKYNVTLDDIDNNYRFVHNTSIPIVEESLRQPESSLAKAAKLAGKIYNDYKSQKDKPIVIMCEKDDEREAEVIRDKLKVNKMKARLYVIGQELKGKNGENLKELVFGGESTIIQYKYTTTDIENLRLYERETRRLGIKNETGIPSNLHFALLHSRLEEGTVEYFVTRENVI